MSDLFHEEIPDSFIESVLTTCTAAYHHTFQILTKRAERLPDFFRNRKCPDNVVLGVSVEDKKYGLPRIDYLRKVEAKTRFLSVEPLLEDLGPINLEGVHWVIVGGESGPGSRPMRLAWARNVRDQTTAAGIPFFFKQWGAWGPDGVRRNKKVNGRLLDGLIWDERPKTGD